ncbi:MAG: hypothetical protein ACYSWO_11855 [Planctomycetota bacterium]
MENIASDTKHGPLTGRFATATRRVLEHRYMPAVIAALAAVIMLPALNAGFFQDDMVHRLRLVDPSELPEQIHATGMIADDAGTVAATMRDMHSFARTEQNLDMLLDCGMAPWWTADGWHFANWRPLDSFAHWLDYRLFPDSPPLMHVHNIIWFAALVLLLAILYRQLMTPLWIAALAAFLYTIDDSNYFPAMWIANRNLLLALFFSILTLLLHHKWRHKDSLASGVAAPFTLLLSLLSTEAGIATFAYLFSYALIIEQGGRIKRIASLAPSFIVIVGWRIIYNSLGYGARGSGFVIDPVREPVRYMQAVLERAPLLFAGQWGATSAELVSIFSDYARGCYLLVSMLFLIVVLLVLVPLLRKNRVARYWFLGTMLSILPICATIPMNRNLLFVAIGAFALMAQFIGGLFARQDWAPRSRLWRVPAWIICMTFILTHVGFTAASRVKAPAMMSFAFDKIYSTVRIDPAQDLTGKTLVVVNAPNPFLFMGVPALKAYWDEPLPERTRVLAPGFRPLKITRTGDRTLLVESRAGDILSVDTSRRDFVPNFAYFANDFNSLFRPADMPFQTGHKTELSDMSVEVVAVGSQGQPTKVRFDFAVSLDDPSLVWCQWTWKKGGLGSYSRFKIPAVREEAQTNGPFGAP